MARIVIQDTSTGEIRQINDVALPFFPGYVQVDTIDDEFPPTLFYTGAAADARYVNVAEISDPDSPGGGALRAASVAALEDEATVAPAGAWDFAQAPTVAGVAIGTGSGSAPDATPTTKGVVQLAGDLGGTAASPTVPGLATRIAAAEKGAPNGVATLDSGGKIPQAQVPAIALTEYLGAVASQAAMLALTGQRGDWATRTDLGTDWQLIAEPSTSLSSWRQMTYPASPVSSVAGRTGAVTLSKADVGLGSVDNTSDANKPVSTAQQTALDAKAPLTGAEGIKVHDGTTGGGTRPTGYARVRWIGGTARPTNMTTGDVWEHDA